MTKQELKELITPEFLSTLHSAVEYSNWCFDMIETMEFCKWCYSMAGKRCPNFNVDIENIEMEDV
jgi:hypothetical protein